VFNFKFNKETLSALLQKLLKTIQCNSRTDKTLSSEHDHKRARRYKVQWLNEYFKYQGAVYGWTKGEFYWL